LAYLSLEDGGIGIFSLSRSIHLCVQIHEFLAIVPHISLGIPGKIVDPAIEEPKLFVLGAFSNYGNAYIFKETLEYVTLTSWRGGLYQDP
jgi:hypothetical protein